jgi:hypothetical protein
MQADLLDDPLIIPPSPPACIPGLTIDLTQRIRAMQRASLLKAYLDLGAAQVACNPLPTRRRRWRGRIYADRD